MPRTKDPTKPPRQYVGVRLGVNGLNWVDDTALATTTSRSDVVRAALVIAKKHERETIALLRGKK